MKKIIPKNDEDVDEDVTVFGVDGVGPGGVGPDGVDGLRFDGVVFGDDGVGTTVVGTVDGTIGVDGVGFG